MQSHYLLLKKKGATSYLEEMMTSMVLEGNLGVMGAYKSHRKEQAKVVHMICDRELEAELLVEMKRERVRLGFTRWRSAVGVTESYLIGSSIRRAQLLNQGISRLVSDSLTEETQDHLHLRHNRMN